MGTVWSLLVILLIGIPKPGLAIYFAESNNFTFSPVSWPQNNTIHVFTALLEPDDLGHVTYSIFPGSKNQQKICPRLNIHPQLGQLQLSNAMDGPWKNPKDAKKCEYRVEALLVGTPGARKKSVDNIFVKFNLALYNSSTNLSDTSSSSSSLSSKDAMCRRLSLNSLCFDGIKMLNLSIMENSVAQRIAGLGSLNQLCGIYDFNYTINSEVLRIEGTDGDIGGAPYTLWVQGHLDREVKDLYSFTITCHAKDNQNNSVLLNNTMVNGYLMILDQNDSPVEPQDEKILNYFYLLKNDDYYKGFRLHPTPIAKDLDTFEMNGISMISLNDTLGLLDIQLTVVNINSPLYNKNNISSTAVYPRMSLSENVTFQHRWEGEYCVAADLIDNYQVIKQSPLSYLFCLGWNARVVNKSSPPLEIDESFLQFNGSTVLSIPRSISSPAPILYTFPHLAVDNSQLLPGISFEVERIVAFYAENKEPVILFSGNATVLKDSLEYSVLSVTKRSGIVYVSNSAILKNKNLQSLNLTLQWRWSTSSGEIIISNATFTIEIEDASPDSITPTGGCMGTYCSEHSEEASCSSSCAEGVLTTCTWINGTGGSAIFLGGEDDTTNTDPKKIRYSTCTSHLETCPDGKCDELEWDYPSLCPQDCAQGFRGIGGLRQSGGKTTHGLSWGQGVCTCHLSDSSSICSCNPVMKPFDETNNKTNKNKERLPNRHLTTGDAIDVTSKGQVTYKTGDNKPEVLAESSQCGNGCIVVSSVSIFVMLGVIFLIFVVWRRQGDKKRKSAQSPMVGTDMELSNGFGDRGENRILLPDAEYASSGLHNPRSNGFFPTNALFNPDNFFQVESKWEIPREDLILDHVLGEGEFGRVLKGVMRTSNGTMHVAVKMLKVDETEGHKSVRQEFMSEFSLLKQLDHTNVIKLLGASTSNRCPPLLVMEYAEFGSLKSFLRKCRRVEKINHVVEKAESLYEVGIGVGVGIGGRNIGHFRNSTEVSDYFVTPQEVLGFSWQIAKGMAYLSDMKMVHRDLAARNVLITKSRMCKISDFGLTRDIYVDDAYKKKSKDRVPVKWLAPECLTDELYTSKSDVWAFGVLLWEQTTMGSSPYPGIQSELLYSLLDSGYRMPQPPNCSNEVYSIMKKCWAKVPSDRPTFHELVFELSRLLENGIEYLKLDIPSAVSNPGYDIFNSNE